LKLCSGSIYFQKGSGGWPEESLKVCTHKVAPLKQEYNRNNSASKTAPSKLSPPKKAHTHAHTHKTNKQTNKPNKQTNQPNKQTNQTKSVLYEKKQHNKQSLNFCTNILLLKLCCGIWARYMFKRYHNFCLTIFPNNVIYLIFLILFIK